MTHPRNPVNDDLFTPTVTARAGDLARPWRVDSLLYPAFFGGPLAGAALGLINGHRLRVGRGAMVTVGAVGLGAFAARAAILMVVGPYSGSQLVGTIAGVAVWGAIWATQRRAFRSFQLTGDDPARLFWPGLGVAALGVVVELFLIGAAALLVRNGIQ
jgi:hypothetical protein